MGPSVCVTYKYDIYLSGPLTSLSMIFLVLSIYLKFLLLFLLTDENYSTVYTTFFFGDGRSCSLFHSGILVYFELGAGLMHGSQCASVLFVYKDTIALKSFTTSGSYNLSASRST